LNRNATKSTTISLLLAVLAWLYGLGAQICVVNFMGDHHADHAGYCNHLIGPPLCFFEVLNSFVVVVVVVVVVVDVSESKNYHPLCEASNSSQKTFSTTVILMLIKMRSAWFRFHLTRTWLYLGKEAKIRTGLFFSVNYTLSFSSVPYL
jgi:hypothetical protein